MTDKNTETTHRQIIGEPFTATQGFRQIEAAVYRLEGYGQRIIAVNRSSGTGAIAPSRRAVCIHSKPINGSPFDIKHGDLAGYAQICNLCTYEVAHLGDRQ